MDNDRKKFIAIRVDEQTHKQMKLHVVKNDTTIQDYLMELIKKDLEQNKLKEKGGTEI